MKPLLYVVPQAATASIAIFYFNADPGAAICAYVACLIFTPIIVGLVDLVDEMIRSRKND